jgi:hypothetical protein
MTSAIKGKMQTPHGQQWRAVARMQTHSHTSMYRMHGHRLCGVRPRLGLGSHIARGWREDPGIWCAGLPRRPVNSIA